VRAAPGLRTAVLLAALSGVLGALPFLRFRLWPVGWVALVPLFFALEGATMARSFLVGWVAGTATTLTGFYWIMGLLVRFAGMAQPLALVLHVVHAAWGGIAWGLACLLAAAPGPGGIRRPLALCAAFMIVEWSFPLMFPWNMSGGQYLFLPFVQAADLVGALGLTGLVVAGNAAVHAAASLAAGPVPAERRRARAILAACLAGLVGAGIAYGALRIRSVDRARDRAPSVTVGVVQPNVAMDEKGELSHAGAELDRLHELTGIAAASGADLVVWPESAYPYRMPRSLRRAPAGSMAVISGHDAAVVFGAISRGPAGRYNSAFLATPGGGIAGPVDKVHLVLFSEWIPLRDRIPRFVSARYPFVTSTGFDPGDRPGRLDVGSVRAGILICFEDIFTRHARDLAGGGANLLVNLTNDAWFGDTAEPEQHLALAALRAVETRRDLVRSVNTGVSAVVEATGRVAYRTGAFEEAVFVREVRLLDGSTPYCAAGAWLGWVALGSLVLAALAARIRDRREGGAGTGGSEIGR